MAGTAPEAGVESVPAAREDAAGPASKEASPSESCVEAKAEAASAGLEPTPAETGAPAAACIAKGSAEASGDGSDAGSPPEGAEAQKALGNTAFQAKRYAEAIRHYSEAILQAGDAAPGVYFSNRAVCRAALGEWAEARSDAAEALKRPGGLTKKALFQKARAELRLQLAEEAEATLRLAGEQGLRADVEKLLKEEFRSTPQASPAPATASTQPAAAAASGASSVAGTSAASSAPADAAAKAKESGNAKYKEGAYREALAEYRRALELLPSDDAERRAPLLGNVAAACLMLRRVDECISVCEQSLALDSRNAKIRSRLATAQVALGDFVAARAALAAAEGGDAAALANASKLIDDSERELAAADAALKGGEPAKALGKLAELETKALFSCPAVSLKMGRCYLELKNYPRVLNTTQQVLRANPRNIDALVLRSEALYRNNDASVDSAQWTDPLEQGQRLLKEALSFDPDHAGAQALRKRLRQLCGGHLEFKAAFGCREFEKAQETLDQMIEQGQDNPVMLASLYCERAKCGIRRKDWPRVLKDVGQATYRNHGLVQPYLFRAQALQALDRHEDAVKELEGLLSWHREQSVFEKLQEAKFLLRKKKRANYYELLGVPTVASQLEIKKGYRERAAEWHPDKKGHLDEAARKNAEEMFKRIGEAYEVLTDPQKKEYYDKGYDLEGIDEQIELKKRRTEGHGHGHGHGHCGSGHCC